MCDPLETLRNSRSTPPNSTYTTTHLYKLKLQRKAAWLSITSAGYAALVKEHNGHKRTDVMTTCHDGVVLSGMSRPCYNPARASHNPAPDFTLFTCNIMACACEPTPVRPTLVAFQRLHRATFEQTYKVSCRRTSLYLHG